MMSPLIELARQNESKRNALATFVPTVGSEEELVEAALVASLADPSPTGRSVLGAARERLKYLRKCEGKAVEPDEILAKNVRKRNERVLEGNIETVEKWVRGFGGMIHNHLRRMVTQTQGRGGMAVVVASAKIDLGVVCFRSQTGA